MDISVIASAKPREIKLRRFFKTEYGDIVLFSSRVIATNGGSECRAKNLARAQSSAVVEAVCAPVTPEVFSFPSRISQRVIIRRE